MVWERVSVVLSEGVSSEGEVLMVPVVVSDVVRLLDIVEDKDVDGVVVVE